MSSYALSLWLMAVVFCVGALVMVRPFLSDREALRCARLLNVCAVVALVAGVIVKVLEIWRL